MSNSPTETSNLSPLDQIRQVESEVTRRLAAAREAAEQTVAQARSQVTPLKNQARDAGRRAGQEHYEEIVHQADEEARRLVAEAQEQAEGLRIQGQQRMDSAIRQAVKTILSMDIGEGEA